MYGDNRNILFVHNCHTLDENIDARLLIFLSLPGFHTNFVAIDTILLEFMVSYISSKTVFDIRILESCQVHIIVANFFVQIKQIP
jgi:hypothetical protein